MSTFFISDSGRSGTSDSTLSRLLIEPMPLRLVEVQIERLQPAQYR